MKAWVKREVMYLTDRGRLDLHSCLKEEVAGVDSDDLRKTIWQKRSNIAYAKRVSQYAHQFTGRRDVFQELYDEFRRYDAEPDDVNMRMCRLADELEKLFVLEL